MITGEDLLNVFFVFCVVAVIIYNWDKMIKK